MSVNHDILGAAAGLSAAVQQAVSREKRGHQVGWDKAKIISVTGTAAVVTIGTDTQHIDGVPFLGVAPQVNDWVDVLWIDEVEPIILGSRSTHASPSEATLTVSPVHATAGSTISINGSHFHAGATVSIVWSDSGHTTVTATADSLGAFTHSATVPSDPIGAYTLSASDSHTPTATASATFTIDSGTTGDGVFNPGLANSEHPPQNTTGVTISVYNASTFSVNTSAINAIITMAQTTLNACASDWGKHPCTIQYVSGTPAPRSATHWWLRISTDGSYHTSVPASGIQVPDGTCIAYSGSSLFYPTLCAVLVHEAVEMFIDPVVDFASGAGYFWTTYDPTSTYHWYVEVCDPIGTYASNVSDPAGSGAQLTASPYVLPSWFTRGASGPYYSTPIPNSGGSTPAAPTAPFNVAGYADTYDSGGNYHQLPAGSY